jgi:hypothetical protein
MTSRSEEFRAKAEECQEFANRGRDEGQRQHEELARQWRELADQAAGRARSCVITEDTTMLSKGSYPRRS